jgi:serine/threonine protein kinase
LRFTRNLVMRHLVTALGYEFDIPSRIDRYIVQDTIHSGTYGVVVVLRDRDSGAYFAAKVMSRSYLSSQNLLPQLDREITLADQLRHPNIIKFEAVLESDDLVYIVMENCDCGNLLTWITDNPSDSLDAKKRIFSEVLSAVLYLHDRQMNHGDLKPENVCIDSDGHPKLIDFAFSTSTRFVKGEAKYGTATYAAPELFELGEYDPAAADVWALGILLFVLVTGRMPYRGESREEIRAQAIAGEIVWPPLLDEDARDLIRRCTAVDAKERPSVRQICGDRFLAGGEAAGESLGQSLLDRENGLCLY